MLARLADDELSQRAIECLPNGVLLARPDGTIAFVNRQLERQFGCSRTQLVGQRVDALLPGSELQPQPLLMAEEKSGRRVLDARHSNGSRFPVEISCRTIETAQGTFILVGVTDATTEHGTHSAARERSEFEELVAELSIQFINLSVERVETAIQDALRRIGEGLDFDSCNFYRIHPDGTLSDLVSWARPGHPPVPLPESAGQSFPWALEAVRAGKVLCFSSLDEIPSATDQQNFRALGIRSVLTVPISVAGQITGAVTFNTRREQRRWDSETVHRLTVVGAVFGSVLARQKSDEALRETFAETERLRDQLAAENVYLRREVHDRFGKGHVVGQGAAVQRVLAQVRQVALTDATVLLLGETGTGKELFATQIHELSERRTRAMIRVNCAAIPATLIESELFGREKGAFTGALSRQVGRFELADRSTIFLDEIGDLPLDVQVKLLRVLEERQVERLGSPRPIRIDARIIAATHRNLEQRVAEGTFREDLFYRLNVFPINVPPLRERVEDIPLLVWRFVDEFAKAFGRRLDSIPRENMTALEQYSWPGNIRELRNIVERAVIAAKGPRLTITVPAPTAAAARRSVRLLDVEREHIRGVLERSGWRIRGAGGAADRLGLRPTTLETRMARLGLVRPKP